jgi:hypothetical protein
MTRGETIVLSLPGWEEIPLDDTARAEGTLRAWSDEAGSQLSLHRFDLKPDLVAPLSDVSALREQWRHMVADQNGAVVSVDRVEVSGLQALKTVLKFQQDPHGMTYVGSYTFPFETFSYVVRVVCPELGTTGIRDTLVAQKAGGITEDGIASDWFQDPYDSKFKASVLRNKSDDEEWDSLFPDHPLSRARAALESVAAECEIADELRDSRPFTGPRGASKGKGWWRRLTER